MFTLNGNIFLRDLYQYGLKDVKICYVRMK